MKRKKKKHVPARKKRVPPLKNNKKRVKRARKLPTSSSRSRISKRIKKGYKKVKKNRRNTKPKKKTVPIKRRDKKTTSRSRSLPSKTVERFRGTDGKFITRKQWEKLNLPKKKRKSRKRRWVEKDSYITPKAKYQYRQFDLMDFLAETIRSVMEFVFGEDRPWPILFFIYLECTDEDETKKVMGTPFFKFEYDSCQSAQDACEHLVATYGIANVDTIQMHATYSIVKEK